MSFSRTDLVTVEGLPGFWRVEHFIPARLVGQTMKPAVVAVHQEISTSRCQDAHRNPNQVTLVAPADAAPGATERI